MAHRDRAQPENVPGTFFVDAACIDCDTCRQVAPLTFIAVNGHSAVRLQPTDPDEIRRAAAAAVACPVDAIGGDPQAIRHAATAVFPQPISPNVWYTGWTSRHSFGASSYLAQTANGLWMIDSPRYAKPLADWIEAHGGLTGIFLTHRDDIADAAKWAERFHAPRWIHAADADAHPQAEHQFEGDEPRDLAPGIHLIPTPGHTAGSCSLLIDGHLFSGDHLWWSRPRQRLHASRDYCWYDWPTQIDSVRRLLDYDIHAILPGHGERRIGTVHSLRTDIDQLLSIIDQPDDGTEWN